MPTILLCHCCGATNAVRRQTCGRCGRPLTLVTKSGKVETSQAFNRRRRWLARLRGASAVLGTVIAVTALVAVTKRIQPAGGPQLPSLRHMLDATQVDGGDDLAAPPQRRVEPVDSSGETLAAYKAGDLDTALELHLAALRRRPRDAALENNIGQLLIELDRLADAIPHLIRAVELEPGQATYRFNVATALGRHGEHERALREWERLAAEGPRDARVHHNMGLVLRRMDRNEDAAAAFRLATDLAPAEAPAWRGLALCLDRLRQGDDAARAYERYLALDPQAADADQIRQRVDQIRTRAGHHRVEDTSEGRESRPRQP